MNRHKILIVDDQQSNIALLRSQLKEFIVIEAEDGRAALKKVVEEWPDLILLDVMMPGIDGYSVLSILKNSEKTQFIPVILITALNNVDDKIKSLEKGADDFISKPVNPLELLARIKNLLRLKDLQEQMVNVHKMLISVVLSVESKQAYKNSHSIRTSFYAEKLAQKIYSTSHDREKVKIGALLHDIGFIAVKESIFLQPGELDEEKFGIVKTHPVVGEKICSSISVLNPILPYIRHHHENFDGTGYPDGLKEKEIPLGARILAVADAFDAMTNERPHREAYSHEKALGILREGAGKQWDPLLVERFCQIVEEEKGSINDEAFTDFEKYLLNS